MIRYGGGWTVTCLASVRRSTKLTPDWLTHLIQAISCTRATCENTLTWSCIIHWSISRTNSSSVTHCWAARLNAPAQRLLHPFQRSSVHCYAALYLPYPAAGSTNRPPKNFLSLPNERTALTLPRRQFIRGVKDPVYKPSAFRRTSQGRRASQWTTWLVHFLTRIITVNKLLVHTNSAFCRICA